MRNAKFAVAAAAALFAGVQSAQAVNIWLSTSGQPLPAVEPVVSNPVIDLAPGQSTTLYVWIKPGGTTADERWTGMSLTTEASTPNVVSASGSVVYQAANEDGDARWNLPINSGALVAGGLVRDTNAVAVGGPYGIRLGTISATDSLRVGTSFLYQAITLTAGQNVGSTNVFIKVGDKTLSNAINADSPVFFGAGDASVSGKIVGAVSTLPDATINVIPEPASLSLLALGALPMLRRRRA